MVNFRAQRTGSSEPMESSGNPKRVGTMPHDESAKAWLLGSSESQVDYSAVLADLQRATPFDLYRLRSALDRMLDDPATIARAKRMVHVGDEVEYYREQNGRDVTGWRGPAIVADLSNIEHGRIAVRTMTDRVLNCMQGHVRHRLAFLTLLYYAGPGRSHCE